MDILMTFAALGFGYLLGSLNSSIIVAKVCGVDIRAHGSKNAGLTNTLRVLGKTSAVFVFLGDIAKGVIACLIGMYLCGYTQAGVVTECVSLLAAGIGAVVGHNWPVYFQFRGGKGLLTAAAVMFMIDWVATSMSLGVFIAIVAVTRYVSLGSIVASLFFVVIAMMSGAAHSVYFHATSVLLASIIIFRHRENIHRLLSGNENRLTF